MRVLCVCLGNICRSPTGEGLLQSLVLERGMSDLILVDSAGTGGYHIGNRADPRMRSAAAKRGYQLASRARQVTHTDLETFDLVIAMDRDNYSSLRAVHSQPVAEIRLLSDFLEGDWPVDVPDPYYGGLEGFDYVIDMIEAACPRIVDYLVGEFR